MENKKISVEIDWNTFWKVLVFVGLLLLFFVAKEALTVLFTAIVIALGIDPIVSFLEKRGVNRLFGTFATFLLAVLVLSAAIYLIVPIIIVEGGAFMAQLNDVFARFFGFGIPEAAIEGFSTSLNKTLGFLASTNISITGAISTVFTNLVLILSTIIISFYLSIEKDGTERLLKVILPTPYEGSVLEIFNRFKIKIRRWLMAQLGLSLIIGVVTAVGLWLLGVRYALILGLIAAIFELVPVIGPILSGVIAFLIAISDSLALGLYVAAFFFVVQQLENNALIPILMRKAMRIHPVMVLIALIAGAQAAGIVGIILAVPIALIAQESFNYLSDRKNHRDGSKLRI